jgi:DNA-binding transcriptional MerR regulator
MRDDSDLLKIGDFARLAGTNLRTLRYYEELGLITPAARSQGGFRYYRPTDVNRVQLIRDLQELGLHLDRIRDLVGSRLGSESRSGLLCRVREALAEHERLLEERMRTLEEQRGRVHGALEKLGHCESCELTPSAENNFCEPCARTGAGLPQLLSALF